MVRTLNAIILEVLACNGRFMGNRDFSTHNFELLRIYNILAHSINPK